MPYLRLLGGVALEGRGEGRASHRHPLALLGLLAASPARTMSRSKLVGLLWPESSEERARHRLSTCLYNVRQDLGADVLVSTGDDVRLDPAHLPCDVIAFERAMKSGDHERAVELYGGAFMDGFHLDGTLEFERIVEQARTRIQRAYWSVLETLALDAAERGDHRSAAEWWRRRATEDPYDTTVAVRRVQALRASGNPAAALRTAREHEQKLREELGVEPPVELEATVARLGRRRGIVLGDVAPPAEPAKTGPVGVERPAATRGAGPPTPRRVGVLRVVLVAITVAVTMVGGRYLLGSLVAEGPHVAPGEVRTPTADLEAYRLYLEARRLMDSREGSDLLTAVDGFRRAIERDPDYALAWAGLADAMDLLSYKGFDPPEHGPGAEMAARRALKLDPNLAEAHATLGNLALARRDGPSAIRHLRRAVELRPSYGQAHHWLGLAWLVLGRPDAAMEHLQLAVELEPTLVPARRSLSSAYLAVGEFRLALSELRESQSMLDEGSLEYRKTRRDEAIVLYHLKRYADVRRLVREKGMEWPGGDRGVGPALLAMIDVTSGDPARARQRLDQMVSKGAPHLHRAWVYAALGEEETALEELAHPVERKGDAIALLVRYGFPEELVAVRADPGYRPIIQRLNENWGLEADGSLPVSYF